MVLIKEDTKSYDSGWSMYLPAIPSRRRVLTTIQKVNQIALPIAFLVLMAQIEVVEGGKSKCIHACKDQKFAGDNNVFTNAVCWAVCKLPGIEALIAGGKTIAEAVKLIKEIKEEL